MPTNARRHDPEWPALNGEPAEGAMDDALNDAFSEAVQTLHARGTLLDVEDDFDFGSPNEDWIATAVSGVYRLEFFPNGGRLEGQQNCQSSFL